MMSCGGGKRPSISASRATSVHIVSRGQREGAEMAADDAALEALGKYALRFVKSGQVIGLGTGHAASAFIRALGAAGVEVKGVPTSKPAEELGRSVGIP